jgi:predicted RNA binding protein YcfA (HicA-like mRNA interferase family)
MGRPAAIISTRCSIGRREKRVAAIVVIARCWAGIDEIQIVKGESCVSKREKLRRKIRQHPAETKMSDVQTLLEGFGFVLARIHGSHHIFEYDDGERFQQIVVPLHGRKVKKIYVERIVNILDDLFPEETDGLENGEDA